MTNFLGKECQNHDLKLSRNDGTIGGSPRLVSLTPRLSAFPGWGGIFGQNFKTPGGFPLKVPINIQLPGLPCAAQQLRQQRISHAFVVGVEHLALRVVALQPLPRALQLLRVLPEPQFATRSGERDGSDPPPPRAVRESLVWGSTPPHA